MSGANCRACGCDSLGPGDCSELHASLLGEQGLSARLRTLLRAQAAEIARLTAALRRIQTEAAEHTDGEDDHGETFPEWAWVAAKMALAGEPEGGGR